MSKHTKLGASGILYHNGQILLGLRAKDERGAEELLQLPGIGLLT